MQIGAMSDYVDPVVSHCTAKTEKYPGVPLFIVGHSMGGLISLLTVLETQVLCSCNQYDLINIAIYVKESAMFQGMVLTGPLIALDPAMASPVKVLLAKLGSKVWPGFSMGGIDPKLVTSDQVAS